MPHRREGAVHRRYKTLPGLCRRKRAGALAKILSETSVVFLSIVMQPRMQRNINRESVY